MRLQILAAVAGVVALGLTALPQAASADARLPLGLAGLAQSAAAIETVGYYNRRHRSHSSHGTRRPRFDHRRRHGPADGYGTAPRKYGYRRDPRFRQFHDPRRPSGTTVRRTYRPYYHFGHTRPFYRHNSRRGYRRYYRPYSRYGRQRYNYRSRYHRPTPRGRR
ncbi:MAG: hypothetical protein ACR2PO_16410 [Methyloligellaceae bacterium]